jgi:hypothetical protein
MSLAEYFGNVQGIGILGTADSSEKVDLAIYARPHIIDETTIALIMSDRLSHKNLQSNPNAAYMFIEHEAGYVGKRLYLTKIREETDPKAIESIRRDHSKRYADPNSVSYLVYFRVEKIRPLVGD